MSSRTLFFVTSNPGKLAEVKAILSTSGVNLESKNVDITEIQGTIEEITRDKAKRAAEQVSTPVCLSNRWKLENFVQIANDSNQVGGPVIIEDTCLCFDALKGLPGPYVYVPTFL